MKKLPALGIITLLLLLVACSNNNNEVESGNIPEDEAEAIPQQSPELHLSLTTRSLPVQNFQGAKGTVSWIYYSASGEHPLDFWKGTLGGINFRLFVGQLESSYDSEIQMHFSHFPPSTVTVHRWRTEFIGMSAEMWNKYEPIKVIDNIIFINDTGYDYIYEVIAIWEQDDDMPINAKAFYTFRINGGR